MIRSNCAELSMHLGFWFISNSNLYATKQFKPSSPETGKVVIKRLWDFDGHLEASLFIGEISPFPSEKVWKKRAEMDVTYLVKCPKVQKWLKATWQYLAGVGFALTMFWMMVVLQYQVRYSTMLKHDNTKFHMPTPILRWFAGLGYLPLP